MRDKFDGIIKELPSLLERLKAFPLTKWGDFNKLPKGGGIYVWYEKGKPIYAGRTNNFKNRLRQHGAFSSNHYSASFAFRLAKEKFANHKAYSNSELVQKMEFKTKFTHARERVRGMSYRIIGIKDPVIQHVFEVYAALKLNTKYNEWDTH